MVAIVTGELQNGHTNGAHANGANGNGRPSEVRPLRILIAGSGIGGLTAAIALRQQGHDVELFEQSALARETGAAVHLAPNSNGILRRLGIFAETFGANAMDRLTEYDSNGEVKQQRDLRASNLQWQHPWLLAHRINLHNNLKTTATAPIGPGTATLKTSSKVVSVDALKASITLEDGSTHHGDVVLGADGVHSITRKFVPGCEAISPYSSGKSAFRFLIPRSAVAADPVTEKFVQEDGELIIWYANDRRIVMYPTSGNTQLNFVCSHPESETLASSADAWDQSGSVDKLLEVYKSFEPAVLKLLSKAEPSSVKIWKLLDMKALPSWSTGRLALLGDAAHPFTPHQGQGAGVAMEDAASLSVVLPKGTKPEEVADRLKLYEQIRMERAHRIQHFSRLIGQDLDQWEKFDMYGFTNYNFGHDEFDNSAQRLREWTWAQTPKMYWRMPIAFGPMPGPRQSHYGVERDGTASTFTTASIKFKTSRTMLQNLFPPGRRGWRFTNPGTVAYASFSQTTLNKMEWLGGSGYKHIGLYVHGVEYEKKDGTTVKGTYLPLLFESLTDPIVSGREELGMPKLYTSVDIYRRSASYRIRTGWEGALWGNFLLEGLVEGDASSEGGSISGEADAGILAYRYIPRVGRQNKGVAAEEHATFDAFAEAKPKPRVQKIWTATKPSFSIDALDWEQLPTMHHIISRLAELPVYEVVAGKVVEGVGVPDVATAAPIE